MRKLYASVRNTASRHLIALLVFVMFSGSAIASDPYAPSIYESVSLQAEPKTDSLSGVAPKQEPIPLDVRPPSYCKKSRYWQILPQGLLYKSYLAGVKEPRLASKWEYERDFGWMWDVTLGGRVGVLRYGTDDTLNPEGWQIDIEGAAQPRLSYEDDTEVVSCDYRAGFPITYAEGPHHYKFGYYHLSAHLGDEWMLRYPGSRRINYSRDVFMVGYSRYFMPDLRLYGEAGYAFVTGELTRPWEFQFGVEYSSLIPRGIRPTPFFAVNGYIREDNDFSGNITVETGLQWRGGTGNLFRMGMIYFNGMSDQYEFVDSFENKLGMGIWYDF